MDWKFCEIWEILWKLASTWAKFCEILSHSVRYGMYGDGGMQVPSNGSGHMTKMGAMPIYGKNL